MPRRLNCGKSSLERFRHEGNRRNKLSLRGAQRRSNLLPDEPRYARQAGDCFGAARLAMTVSTHGDSALVVRQGACCTRRQPDHPRLRASRLRPRIKSEAGPLPLPRERLPGRLLCGGDVDVGALLGEFAALLLHAGHPQRLLAQVLGDAHRTELRAAHRTEMRDLVGFLG